MRNRFQELDEETVLEQLAIKTEIVHKMLRSVEPLHPLLGILKNGEIDATLLFVAYKAYHPEKDLEDTPLQTIADWYPLQLEITCEERKQGMRKVAPTILYQVIPFNRIIDDSIN